MPVVQFIKQSRKASQSSVRIHRRQRPVCQLAHIHLGNWLAMNLKACSSHQCRSNIGLAIEETFSLVPVLWHGEILRTEFRRCRQSNSTVVELAQASLPEASLAVSPVEQVPESVPALLLA